MALPVTRTFGGTTGTIPTADETQWAYNRSGAQVAAVEAGSDSGGYWKANDPTQDVVTHWTGDTFADSHYAEVVMGDISTNGSGVGRGYGPAVRCATGSTQKTYVRLVADSHGWELMRFNNSTGTVIGSDTTAPVRGDVIRLSVVRSGSNDIYTLTKNGSAMVGSPFTDTSPLTGGAAGIAHSSTTSSGGLSQWGINSWTGGNVGSSVVASVTSFDIVGQAVVLRPGATTYLRYRK